MKQAFIAKINSRAEEIWPDLVAIRRHLHQYPELSFQEEKTAAFVSQKLTEWGIVHETGIAGHGITGILSSAHPGKTIALRADLDALPIHEKNEVAYKSTNEGVMHACGHDVHTTCLLGALQILNENKTEWTGKVQFVFQPGEEKLPGGASLLIAAGIFEETKPEAIYGLHVYNPLEVGTVGFRKGMYMASSDELYFTVKGKGGHGAVPELAIDPVPVAAQLITALQTVVSRHTKPTIPSVLTIGKVIANGATNVIPDEVYLEGTFRTLDETNRSLAHNQIRRLAEEIASAYGASCDVRIEKGYPCLINDDMRTENAMQTAAMVLGEQAVIPLDIRMASEDFAFYSQYMPACFFRLGTGNKEKNITANVHQSNFDIDERALMHGAALMASMVL